MRASSYPFCHFRYAFLFLSYAFFKGQVHAHRASAKFHKAHVASLFPVFAVADVAGPFVLFNSYYAVGDLFLIFSLCDLSVFA